MAYENEHYNPKLQYLTGVARDDASYMICKNYKIWSSFFKYVIRILNIIPCDDMSWRILIWFIADNNKTLAPRYDIGWEFFDTMVRDHIVQYNYTLNPEGIFGAIKYMYTYYPDPNNRSHIREEFINVSHLLNILYQISNKIIQNIWVISK